ncbi:MAG: hypothetical protein ACLFUX_10610 [Spirochaetaceae bacterium]
MTVHRIDNIALRDSPVRYRRVYRADAVVNHVGAQRHTLAIEFTIEDTADRGTDLSVRFLDTPDYPLLPATRAVRRFIRHLQTQGTVV